jgi:hypothetical protein
VYMRVCLYYIGLFNDLFVVKLFSIFQTSRWQMFVFVRPKVRIQAIMTGGLRGFAPFLQANIRVVP